MQKILNVVVAFPFSSRRNSMTEKDATEREERKKKGEEEAEEAEPGQSEMEEKAAEEGADETGDEAAAQEQGLEEDMPPQKRRFNNINIPGMKKIRELPRPLMVVLVIGIAVILIASVALVVGFSSGKDSENASGGTFQELETTTITWVDQPIYLEGDIAGGGPGELVPDEQVPFTVNETVVKISVVLSWDPQSHDLDLEVLDASGKIAGSSGNAPGETETVEITKRIKPGEWKAEIDPFFTANVHYKLEITFTHEVEIGGSGDGGDGGSTGPILHQEAGECTDKTASDTNQFDPGNDFSTLLIQFSAQSASGEMSIKITDPDGEVVFEKTVSGTEQVAEQKEVPSKPGKWTVAYESKEK